MIFLYLIIIAVSNVITAMFPPLLLFGGIVIIPTGSIFVGVAFLLRDFVQIRYGKRITYAAIFVASLISAAISWAVGDTMFIAIASIAAFLVSESLDTEIFTRLKRPFACRVALSGIVGGIADSMVFVVLGLSPIGGAILSWEQVPYAILGQALVKAMVQPVGVAGYMLFKKNLPKRLLRRY